MSSALADSEQLSAYRALLGNRNYRLWFLSSLGSSLGDWAGLFALQVLVASLFAEGSRLAVFSLGGVMMARLLPSVAFGPIAGVLADRYDRKRLMVNTDLLRAALFAGIAFSRDVVALFALTFAVECLSLLYIAAKDASLPHVVHRRHLTEANQLNLLVTWGPLPFGAAAAGAMAALASLLRNAGIADIEPTVLALMVNVVTFVVAGLLIARLDLPAGHRRADRDEADATGLFTELREGLEFIRDLPLIRALITGVVGVAFGAGVVVALGPEFVRSTLGEPGSAWFTLVTVVGIGLLVGIALTPVLSARVAQERLFPIFLTSTGVVATAVALIPEFQWTLVAGALLGAVAGPSFVMGYTLLHEYTTDEMRSRTFAAFYTGTRVAVFAALALAPLLAGAVGRPLIGIGGQLFSIAGIRFTLLIGAVIAMLSGLNAARRMFQDLRVRSAGEPARVRLPAPEPGAGTSPTTGLFIVFEGVEGAGKSTQIKRLVATLTNEGHDVLVTREPGGPPVAERVRQMLLDPEATMDSRTEVLLYAAARAQHVAEVIRPALEEGRIVISDRFLDSSLAYQGYARELGEDDVAEINRWATGGLTPDAVILLALDPAEGMRRVAERNRQAGSDPGRPADRIEAEQLDFHRRVATGYLALAKRHRDRFVVVDAQSESDAVAFQVRAALDRWLPLPDERDQAAVKTPARGTGGGP